MRIVRQCVFSSQESDGTIISLSVPIGSCDEQLGYAGIAHLTEHILAREIEMRLMDFGEELYCYAKTYIFHTEFTVWFVADDIDLDAVIGAIKDVLEHDFEMGSSLIYKEAALIEREIDLRKGRRSDGILPWSFSPSFFKSGYSRHNTFDVDYRSLNSLTKKVRQWKCWINQLPHGLGIVSQNVPSSEVSTAALMRESTAVLSQNCGYVPPEWKANLNGADPEVHRVLGLQDKRFLTILSLPQPLRRTSCTPVEFLSFVERAVAVSALNEMGNDYRFTVGLFGPWNSPDDGNAYLYSARFHENWDLSLIDRRVFLRTVRRLDRELVQSFCTPLQHASFLSRCALFAWPAPEEIRKVLAAVAFENVSSFSQILREATQYRHVFTG